MNIYWLRRWLNQIKKMLQDLRGSKRPSFSSRYKTCPACGKFVSATDAVCEYCEAPVAQIQVPTGRFDDSEESQMHLESTYALFGICTFFFALTAIKNYQIQLADSASEGISFFEQLKAYVLPSDPSLFTNLGSSNFTSIFVDGEYWRLFTYMFLHGNLIHIIFNLSALAFLGPLLFSLFGLRRYWLLTLACGAVGAMTSLCLNFFVLHQMSSVVGLSAALFGYVGALYSYYRGTGDITAAEKFKAYMVWGNLFCITVTLLGMPIDNFAHLGGMFTGMIWGHFMFRNASTRPVVWSERLLLIVCCGLWLFGSFFVLRNLLLAIRGG